MGISYKKQMHKSIHIVVCILILIMAFSLRMSATDFSHPIGENSDSAVYHYAAKNLEKYGMLTMDRMGEMYKEKIPASPTAGVMPGFPFFLALLYQVNDTASFIIFIQVLMSMVTVIIIYLSIIELGFPRIVGLWGMTIAALYPGFLYSLDFILTETLFTMLLTLGLWVFIKYLKTYSVRWLALSTFFFMCATMVRAQALPVVVIQVVFIVLYTPEKRKIKHSVLVTAIAIACMLPLWVRNWNTFHSFWLLTAAGDNPKVWGAEPYFLNMASTNGRELKELLKFNFETNPILFVKWRLFGFFKYMWYDLWDENLVHPLWWIKPLRLIHQLIIVPVLATIPFFVRKVKKEILFVACIPILFTIMAMPYHGLPRYVFPSIPAIIIFSSCCVCFLMQKSKNRKNGYRANSNSATEENQLIIDTCAVSRADKIFRILYQVGTILFSVVLLYSVFIFAWDEGQEMSQFRLSRSYQIDIADVDELEVIDDVELINMEDIWNISNVEELQDKSYSGIWDATPILNVTVPTKKKDFTSSVVSKVELGVSGGDWFDCCTIYWQSDAVLEYSEESVYGRFARNRFQKKVTVYIDDDVTGLMVVPVCLRGSDFSINSIHITKYLVS